MLLLHICHWYHRWYPRRKNLWCGEITKFYTWQMWRNLKFLHRVILSILHIFEACTLFDKGNQAQKTRIACLHNLLPFDYLKNIRTRTNFVTGVSRCSLCPLPPPAPPPQPPQLVRCKKLKIGPTSAKQPPFRRHCGSTLVQSRVLGVMSCKMLKLKKSGKHPFWTDCTLDFQLQNLWAQAMCKAVFFSGTFVLKCKNYCWQNNLWILLRANSDTYLTKDQPQDRVSIILKRRFV